MPPPHRGNPPHGNPQPGKSGAGPGGVASPQSPVERQAEGVAQPKLPIIAGTKQRAPGPGESGPGSGNVPPGGGMGP